MKLDEGMPIPVIKGYIKRKFERRTGEGRYGPYSFENIVLQDTNSNAEIGVALKTCPPLRYEEGDLIWLISKDTSKGFLGVKMKWDDYNKQMALEVSDKATIADSDVRGDDSGRREYRDPPRGRQEEPRQDDRRAARRPERQPEPERRREAPDEDGLTLGQKMTQLTNFWFKCRAVALMAAEISDEKAEDPQQMMSPEAITALTTALWMNVKHPKSVAEMPTHVIEPVFITAKHRAKPAAPEPEPEPEPPDREPEPPIEEDVPF